MKLHLEFCEQYGVSQQEIEKHEESEGPYVSVDVMSVHLLT